MKNLRILALGVLMGFLFWDEASNLDAALSSSEKLAPASHWQHQPHSDSFVRKIAGDRTATVLFNLADTATDLAARALIYRYSQYKYGDFEAIRFFGKRLAAIIRELHGDEISRSPQEWVVVSPPYISLPSPSQALADFVAAELGIKRVRLYIVQGDKPVLNYSALDSKTAREDAAKTVDFFAPRPESLADKHVLLLDDLINTGTTLAITSQKIAERYHSKNIELFGLLSLDTDKPQLEEWANSILLHGGSLDKIIAILNNPRTVINKYAVARILHADVQTQITILSQLTEDALQKFYEAVEHFYYGLGRQDSFLAFQKFLGEIQSRTMFVWKDALTEETMLSLKTQWKTRFNNAAGGLEFDRLPWAEVQRIVATAINGKDEVVENLPRDSGLILRCAGHDVDFLRHADGSWSWEINDLPSDRLLLRYYLQASEFLSPATKEFFLQNRTTVLTVWQSILQAFAARQKIGDENNFALYLLNNMTVGISAAQLKELEKAAQSLLGRFFDFNSVPRQERVDSARVSRDVVTSYLQHVTGLTRFFRDGEKWVPSLEESLKNIIGEKERTGNRKILFLSAGSASGEEAYSLAAAIELALIEFAQNTQNGIPQENRDAWLTSWEYEIVAADMEPFSLCVTALGMYASPFPDGQEHANRYGAILPKYIPRFFEEHGNLIQARQRMRRSVHPMFANFSYRSDRDRVFENPFDGIMMRNVSVHLSPVANIFLRSKIGNAIAQTDRTWFCDDTHAVLAGRQNAGPVTAIASIIGARVHELARILEETEYTECIRIFLQLRGVLPESRLAAEKQVLAVLPASDPAQAQAALQSAEQRMAFASRLSEVFGPRLSEDDILSMMILLRLSQDKIRLAFPDSELPWMGSSELAISASL